ncbi:MAG: aminopeptidase [Dehalococcoidia bacterium]|nr:aminopeptidase [Dehalococcoidia bacterium]
MVEKGKIEKGVVSMLKLNMGLKSSERLLIVTDVPTSADWIKKENRELAEIVERSLLAKMVYEIASEKFPNCNVEFYTYPSVGRNGVEPGKEVQQKMKESDVVIAITSYSLSHTETRENATKSGTRIASMPKFTSEMFYPGGPMVADYTKIHEECKKIVSLVHKANDVIVTSPGGTNLKFSLKGRKGIIDDGIYTRKGMFGNLPAGEVYAAPLEGTTNGNLVVKAGWFANLEEDMTFVFKDGQVIQVNGGGRIGDGFRDILACGKDEEPYLSRRNHAELGIGTNPNARQPDNTLEAEKIRGTAHIAIGDNAHFGGKVSADLHQDFVIPKPTMKFDDKIVIENGEIL